MILVVGATGLLGSEVCRQLRQSGREVRALVRHGSPREGMLREMGVSIVNGDLASRVALEEACTGADTVISTATAMGSKGKENTVKVVDRDGQSLLIDVAKSAGVNHFIYVSLSPNLVETNPLVRYKRSTARAVRESGMHWTLLQPSVFMDVWLSDVLGWDFAKAKGMVFGKGDAPLSWISVHDVARYCVLAVNDPRLLDVEIPLGGPEALPPNDVVRIFEQVSGRNYSVKRAPRVVLAMLSPIVSLFNDRVGSGMGLGAQCARGDVVKSRLQDEIGLKLTTVLDYAQRVTAPHR